VEGNNLTQRRKDAKKTFEARQRFAPLRLCVSNFLEYTYSSCSPKTNRWATFVQDMGKDPHEVGRKSRRLVNESSFLACFLLSSAGTKLAIFRTLIRFWPEDDA